MSEKQTSKKLCTLANRRDNLIISLWKTML